jgi:hypothetical protein
MYLNSLHFSTGVIDYMPMETTVSLSGQNPFEELIILIVDDSEYEGPDDEEFSIQVRLAPNGQDSERVRISADLAEVSVSIIDNERRPGNKCYLADLNCLQAQSLIFTPRARMRSKG